MVPTGFFDFGEDASEPLKIICLRTESESVTFPTEWPSLIQQLRMSIWDMAYSRYWTWRHLPEQRTGPFEKASCPGNVAEHFAQIYDYTAAKKRTQREGETAMYVEHRVGKYLHNIVFRSFAVTCFSLSMFFVHVYVLSCFTLYYFQLCDCRIM